MCYGYSHRSVTCPPRHLVTKSTERPHGVTTSSFMPHERLHRFFYLNFFLFEQKYSSFDLRKGADEVFLQFSYSVLADVLQSSYGLATVFLPSSCSLPAVFFAVFRQSSCNAVLFQDCSRKRDVETEEAGQTAECMTSTDSLQCPGGSIRPNHIRSPDLETTTTDEGTTT